MTSRSTRGPGRLLRAALDAAASGLCVFPVTPRGKTPAVRQDWEGAATRDPDQITRWFEARPHNVGIACGPSDLLVIDLDIARAGEPAPEPWTGARGGGDVLAVLAVAAGQPIPGHDTYCVSTPSGGLHIYYRQPAGLALRNTQHGLGFKIDTRGFGGYIVGAGSVRDDGMYRVSRPGPIAELPAWLAVALTPPPPPEPGTPLQLRRVRAGAYVTAIVESEAFQVAHAAPGTRHAVLLKAARTLGRLVGGGELDETTAVAALREAAAWYVGIKDWTAGKVDRDIADGIAYGIRAPRRIGRGGGVR